MLGFLLARMYWVRGEGSSSYLSNGKFSTSNGGRSVVSNSSTGWASRGGWWDGMGVGGGVHDYNVASVRHGQIATRTVEGALEGVQKTIIRTRSSEHDVQD